MCNKVYCPSTKLSLREKCPNTEFFLVRIFMHSDWIQEITDQKKAPYLDSFHVLYYQLKASQYYLASFICQIKQLCKFSKFDLLKYQWNNFFRKLSGNVMSYISKNLQLICFFKVATLTRNTIRLIISYLCYTKHFKRLPNRKLLVYFVWNTKHWICSNLTLKTPTTSIMLDFTSYSHVSIADFEQVHAGWVMTRKKEINLKRPKNEAWKCKWYLILIKYHSCIVEY